MGKQSIRYLHLDLKGAVPVSAARLEQWILYLAGLGFNGLVLEIDCRLAWDTWPGAGEVLYTKDDIRRVVKAALKAGLDVVPLIQMHGHLHWILCHEQYAGLRENGHASELCPKNPDSLPVMKRWIDETAALFPEAKSIHLGCDETAYVGTCPVCRKSVAEDPLQRGVMGIFIDHAAELCRYALEEKHLRPMIWDDMFCHDNGKSLKYTGVFPKETVFLHWKYYLDTRDQLDLVRSAGLEVWGGSAIRCSWRTHFYSMLNFIGDRLGNIAQWESKGLPVLHTTWSRPNNNWDMYGPWEAIIPEFIAAGDPDRWACHPWRLFCEALDRALREKDPLRLEQLRGEAERLPAANTFEEQGKRFFELGIEFEILQLKAWELLRMIRCTDTLIKHGRPRRDSDPELHSSREDFIRRTAGWESRLAAFWRENELSDYAEYRDKLTAVLFPDLIRP